MIIPSLPFSCWMVAWAQPVILAISRRSSAYPKAAKAFGLDIMDDCPVLVVERTWIERGYTEVDALGPIVEIHATDAARNRPRYPSTVVNDSRVTEARIIGKLRPSLIKTSTAPDLSAAVENGSRFILNHVVAT